MNEIHIGFAIIFVFSFCSLRLLYRMKKHDTVLFMFCELRRELMRFLREHFDTLEKDEAKNYLKLLECVNSEIHFFSRNKKEIYNIINLMDNIRRSTIAVKKIEFSEPTQELSEFLKSFNAIRFNAFQTFSPIYALFFRLVYYKVILFFLLAALKMVVFLQKKEISSLKLKYQVQRIGHDMTTAEQAA